MEKLPTLDIDTLHQTSRPPRAGLAVRVLQITAALGFTVCLGLVCVPLGCGGSNERSTVLGYAREEPPVPPGTFAAMTACVTQAKERLTDTVYALQFDVEVNEHGEAVGAKLLDASLPKEPGMEACLGKALVGMTLPSAALARMPRERVVSPASRGLQGQIWEEALLVGATIELAPIFLTAAAVSVTVIVGVKVTTEAIDAIRRRRDKKAKCLDMYVECDARGYPCNRLIGSTSICDICQTNCISNAPYKFIQCTQCGFK